jgi:hypothetical protein
MYSVGAGFPSLPAAAPARTSSHDHAQPFVADKTRPHPPRRAGFASFDAAFAVAAGLPGMPGGL